MIALSEGHTQIVLVDTDEQLSRWRHALKQAYVCAIDAEWRPNTQKPCATLVQLAFKHGSPRTIILLLDLLAVSKDATKGLLQELFRNKEILKVGFGLASDLSAIATALGPQNSSCTALTNSAVELLLLSRKFRRDHSETIPKAEGPGLAGLIQGLFGKTMDKSLQCSSWGARPLTPAQLQYAALDAACLLGVLELYLQALNEKPPQQSSVSSPKQNAQSSETDTHVTASPSLEESSDPVHLRDECTETQSRIDTVGCSTSVSQCLSVESLENDLQNKLNWSEHPPVEDLRIERVQDRQTSEGLFGRNISPCDNEEQEDLSDCAQSQHGQNGAETSSLEEPNFEASISGYHLSEKEVKQAGQLWGCRLEMSGDRPRLIAADGQLLELNSRDAPEEAVLGFPSQIPWQNSGDEPRFVVDAAQEGLARQLRMFGFDTRSTPNLRKNERGKVFRFLVDTAHEEGRVILSCDRLFFQRRASRQAYWVQGKTKQQQVDEVVRAFDLVVDESNFLSRCGKCNGDFIPRPFTYVDLPQESQKQTIPPKVVSEVDTVFWVCRGCYHVYWRGHQFERCHKHLTSRIANGRVL